MSDTIQWITFATLVVHIVFRFIRENRQRQWDKEDREEAALVLAKTVKDKADEIEQKVESKALALARKVVESAAELARQVEAGNKAQAIAMEKNTKISTEAFKEANTVNQKLEHLGIKQNELQQTENELLKQKAPN